MPDTTQADDLLAGLTIPDMPHPDDVPPEDEDGPAYREPEPEADAAPAGVQDSAAYMASMEGRLADMQRRMDERPNYAPPPPPPQQDFSAALARLENLAARPVQAAAQPYTKEQLAAMHEADPVGFTADLMRMQQAQIAQSVSNPLQREIHALRQEIRGFQETSALRNSEQVLGQGLHEARAHLEGEMNRFGVTDPSDRKIMRDQLEAALSDKNTWSRHVTFDRTHGVTRQDFKAVADMTLGRNAERVFRHGAAALVNRRRGEIAGVGMQGQSGQRGMVPRQEPSFIDELKQHRLDRARGGAKR
jgi:hypothetical protein